MDHSRLCIIAQGSKRVFLGEESFQIGESQMLLVSINLPATSVVLQPPYVGVRLALEPALIIALLQELVLPEEEEVSTQPLMVLPVDFHLMESFLHLIRLLDQPEHIPFLAPLAERELLYRLLIGPAGRVLRAWFTPTSRSAQISQTTRQLRRCYNEPIRVGELARSAGMSVPTFHRHFKAGTTMSPIQFQKHIRLQEAHRMLLTKEKDIASVAYAVGYVSRHQFSRDYRRWYGVTPGQAANVVQKTRRRGVALG